MFFGPLLHSIFPDQCILVKPRLQQILSLFQAISDETANIWNLLQPLLDLENTNQEAILNLRDLLLYFIPQVLHYNLTLRNSNWDFRFRFFGLLLLSLQSLGHYSPYIQSGIYFIYQVRYWYTTDHFAWKILQDHCAVLMEDDGEVALSILARNSLKDNNSLKSDWEHLTALFKKIHIQAENSASLDDRDRKQKKAPKYAPSVRAKVLRFFTKVIRCLGKDEPYKCYSENITKKSKIERKSSITLTHSTAPRFLQIDYWPAMKESIGKTFKSLNKPVTQANDVLRPSYDSESDQEMEPQDFSEDDTSSINLEDLSSQSTLEEETDSD